MALVYNELNASQVVTQVCSPDASGVDIYGGYCNIDGTVTPDIDKLNHDTKILAISNVWFHLGTAKYITGTINISDAEFVTNFLEVGRLIRYCVSAVSYWAAISEITPVTDGYAMTAVALTYDDGWIDNQKLENIVYVGGYSSFQRMHYLDKFNSATGFGVGSRRIIKLLNGEYDDVPSQTLVGCTIQGLDRNKRPKRLVIDKKESDYPTVYYGDKTTLASVANTRNVRYGENTQLLGYKQVFNNTTNAPIEAISNSAQYNNKIELHTKCYGSINYGVGPYANRSGQFDTIIWDDATQKLEFNDFQFNVSAVKAIGVGHGIMLEGMSTCSNHIGNLVVLSDYAGIFFDDKDSYYGTKINNLISLPTDASLAYGIRINSSSTKSVLSFNTAIFTKVTVGLVEICSGTGFKGKVHFNKLAVQDVADLSPDIVTYDELYVIPSGEKIFLDVANENFRVVHPTLLRNGIGIDTEIPESIIRLGDKH